MDLALLILHNLASFIIIISVIVFIHEFGHYYVAKKSGVRIDAFSIGFGKELFGWNDKSGTRWKISLFPLGGYVKMFGDEGAASTPDSDKLRKLSAKEEKVAFHTQSLPVKFAIVAAGPAANFLLAVVILTFFFSYYGRPQTSPEVGNVLENSAALEAGLQPGDLITEINGERVTRFGHIRDAVSLHPGEALPFTYIRDGQEHSGIITPKLSETTDIFGNKVKVGLIGIASGKVAYETLPVTGALWASVEETYTICAKTLVAVGQMITGRRSAEDLSGVLRIGQYSGQATERGLTTVLWFMAVLSINLGLINLFPIPMLDGGHLMYYTIEALSGRPLAEKVQEFGFKVGFVLLVALMLFATFNDLKHFEVF